MKQQFNVALGKKMKMNKVCNRCKVNKDQSQNFKKEKRERLSGVYTWWHPWCFECRNEVKAMWSIFGKPKGVKDEGEIGLWSPTKGTKAGGKKKVTSTVSGETRRKSNKTSNTKQFERPVSKRKVRGHNIDSLHGRVHGSHKRSVGIVKSLRKRKDAENV